MAMFSTTFAQYGYSDQRERDRHHDVGVCSPGDNNDFRNRGNRYQGFAFNQRDRDMQISQINRVYDHKIQSVKYDAYMGWQQKNRNIHNLESDRENEIAQVLRKFRNQNNRFSDNGRRERISW